MHDLSWWASSGRSVCKRAMLFCLTLSRVSLRVLRRAKGVAKKKFIKNKKRKAKRKYRS